MTVLEKERYVNINVGAQWQAGTKTYTLTRLWMQWGDGRWVVRTMYEIKWKKRIRYGTDNWESFVAELELEKAILLVGKIEKPR